MSMFEFPSPINNEAALPNQEKELIQKARVEVMGSVDPRRLSREEFESQATLFHGARNQSFRVRSDYGYEGEDFANDATLGTGLYTTADQELAENYARTRPNGTLWKLMPYQARMLNLTSTENPVNLSFPPELFDEWVEFSRPKILQAVKSPEPGSVGSLRQELLLRMLDSMNGVLTNQNPERFIDLRNDVLGTGKPVFSPVDGLWKQFCFQKGWDGLIFVEGGDHELTRKNDRSHVFYSTQVIGTYEDWQNRKEDGVGRQELP